MRTLFFLLTLFSVLVSCDNNEVSISLELKGYWRWKSTCGGFVGCISSSQGVYRTITIRDSVIELSENGTVTFSTPYTIQNVTDGDASKVYEIELSDGTIWTASVENNNLTIEESIFTSLYEKIK